MTAKQQVIAEALEALVGSRFTLLTLNDMLDQIFGESLTIEDTTDSKDENDFSDNTLLFESKNEDTYGFFDIYYLNTREDDVFYITEVSYDFDQI
jgi:hypothetical protein